MPMRLVLTICLSCIPKSPDLPSHALASPKLLFSCFCFSLTAFAVQVPFPPRAQLTLDSLICLSLFSALGRRLQRLPL